MRVTLTKRQKEILNYVTSYIANNGYSPSLGEIADNFNLRSVATVHEHIKNLEEKGFLEKKLNQPRGIVPSEGSVTKNEIQGISSDKKLDTYLNQIICDDSVQGLSRIPSNSIDLVVTSPPYDDLRDYNGSPPFDLHNTGKELYRVLRDGGIAVMVIQDQTKNFGKTLTSFKTIIDWCDNIGFKLFETTIYRKYGAEGAWWNKRFRVDHEYMPIFLKGDRPQYFDKEPLKIPSKHAGKTLTGGATRLTSGKTLRARPIKINPLKCRGTIWEYLTAGDGSKLKHEHPATFPDKLPYDFIQCFCPRNGVVLDPFVGSGTTMVAAKKLGMNYIGIDIDRKYCEIAKRRIKNEIPNSLQI
ncbi:MAG: site-specific DNA-methyltransferase [Candidatus Colwellbacteria bacterium CG10_big_fil_rev_8_21_14_0_10_42_22]|uniref:Methyltransferase n=1 Tax=Candidatus Colwellbacteria bacterium CG10_big_fil_rev_8_21_14_0_10_42_22 TaxID=1974540 RepID=A0A2H0VIF5_9BACT|nr:MAG: site-specific DNA-methyltransferase [Candidatus Colwellbacteria bacterium CG10_big_fil_rev_8_21_14_0_10_42_22]